MKWSIGTGKTRKKESSTAQKRSFRRVTGRWCREDLNRKNMPDKAPDSQNSTSTRVSSFFIEHLLGSSRNQDTKAEIRDNIRGDCRKENISNSGRVVSLCNQVCCQVPGDGLSSAYHSPSESSLEWYKTSFNYKHLGKPRSK